MKKLIIVSLLLGLLMSCMTAEKHLEKFYDKGGKLEPVERVVTVHDTIPGADGKDSIVERLIEVPCPEPEPPKTRWEVRFDNKRFKDSLKYMRKMRNDSLDHVIDVLEENNALLSDSLKEARKIAKYEEKTDRTTIRKENKRSWLFWLGLTIGVIVTLGLVYVFSRFKKVIFPEN
jgi:hypothetical protein